MGFRTTIAASAFVAVFAASAATSLTQASVDTAKRQEKEASEASIWRTDVAAAIEEARRTKRPLLAVFR